MTWWYWDSTVTRLTLFFAQVCLWFYSHVNMISHPKYLVKIYFFPVMLFKRMWDLWLSRWNSIYYLGTWSMRWGLSCMNSDWNSLWYLCKRTLNLQGTSISVTTCSYCLKVFKWVQIEVCTKCTKCNIFEFPI